MSQQLHSGHLSQISEDLNVHPKTCIAVFISALFLQVQTRNNPKVLQKMIKQSMVHLHHGLLLNSKNEQACWIHTMQVDFRGNMLSEKANFRRLHAVCFHLRKILKIFNYRNGAVVAKD